MFIGLLEALSLNFLFILIWYGEEKAKEDRTGKKMDGKGDFQRFWMERSSKALIKNTEKTTVALG